MSSYTSNVCLIFKGFEERATDGNYKTCAFRLQQSLTTLRPLVTKPHEYSNIRVIRVIYRLKLKPLGYIIAANGVESIFQISVMRCKLCMTGIAKCVMTLQAHGRSMIFISAEMAYATPYYSRN